MKPVAAAVKHLMDVVMDVAKELLADVAKLLEAKRLDRVANYYVLCVVYAAVNNVS